MMTVYCNKEDEELYLKFQGYRIEVNLLPTNPVYKHFGIPHKAHIRGKFKSNMEEKHKNDPKIEI